MVEAEHVLLVVLPHKFEINAKTSEHVADSTLKSGQRIVGDVDFAAAKEVASFITPVPGGRSLREKLVDVEATRSLYCSQFTLSERFRSVQLLSWQVLCREFIPKCS